MSESFEYGFPKSDRESGTILRLFLQRSLLLKSKRPNIASLCGFYFESIRVHSIL